MARLLKRFKLKEFQSSPLPNFRMNGACDSRRPGEVRYAELVLTRMGFFHFVRDYCDPFGSLARAMDEQSAKCEEPDIRGSLIVLPEAFNLGMPYYPPDFHKTPRKPGGAKIPLERALEGLHQIAASRAVAFVAGLIGPQFSSAYWIDNNGPPKLMCHKMGDDKTGNCRQWEGCDDNNPVECDGTCVGALICLDAVECPGEKPAARERREKLIDKLKTCSQRYRVLCIPGCMSRHCMPERDGVYCILANSGSQNSFVKNDQRRDVVVPADAGQNEICLASLPLPS
jgi:predicted amidohydrolase